MLGDAAPGDADEAVLGYDLAYSPFLADGSTADPFANNNAESSSCISSILLGLGWRTGISYSISFLWQNTDFVL